MAELAGVFGGAAAVTTSVTAIVSGVLAAPSLKIETEPA
jgi:hypothetical protein